MTIRPLLVFAIVLGAAACAPPSTQWNRTGATAEDFSRDRDECAARARSYDFALEDRTTVSDRVSGPSDTQEERAGTVRGDIYRECMEARGWRRERTETPRR